MQRSRQELQKDKMEIIFYIRFLLSIFPVGIITCSIYWIIITSSSFWINAIGANILISNIFSILFAFASLIFIIFCIFGIMSDNYFISQFFFVSTVMSFALSFITLSLSTEQSSKKYISDINDYCQRNLQAINDSKSLCYLNNPQWQISKYVRKRTTETYDIYVGILAPYVVIFIIFVIMCISISSKNKNSSRNAKDNNNPLITSNDQSDFANLDNEQNNSNNNNDTEQLLNTNNQSQPNPPQNNEERLNFDLDQGYEYVTEEEDEEQFNSIDITVNPHNQTHPVENNSNAPHIIKLSDTA
ncbi:hypothetical protein M9Y10_043346 [Tritrichomonas musculus]|uniref:Transmembrane protein n=1 Tax=Tritrichomonas musculus TaxID=1915356 RepID=A0ABR2K0G6_9EUKA